MDHSLVCHVYVVEDILDDTTAGGGAWCVVRLPPSALRPPPSPFRYIGARLTE